VVIVRDARVEDASAVARIHVRSWQVAYRGLLPDEYLDELRPEDRVGRYLFGDHEPNRPATIVAVTDGLVRGFATTGPARDADAAQAGERYALYLEPDAWGLGLGRRLIAEARARLGRQGFREAVLWVLVGNSRAERLYRADGWDVDGHRREGEVWGVLVDEVRYRRSLVGLATSD